MYTAVAGASFRQLQPCGIEGGEQWNFRNAENAILSRMRESFEFEPAPGPAVGRSRNSYSAQCAVHVFNYVIQNVMIVPDEISAN